MGVFKVLIDVEKIRYSRQITLDSFGIQTQEKLKKARVLAVGAGGLASPLLLYLAAAGVGTLGILDDSMVDISDLQRQLIHDTDKLGEYKCFSAQETLDRINPHIDIETWPTTLRSNNALDIIKQYDIIAVTVDSYASRSLVNQAAIYLKKTQIWGTAVGYIGYMGIFKPWLKNAPCFRCLSPRRPLQQTQTVTAEAGNFPTLYGIVGSMQAGEVIKEIAGFETHCHQVTSINALNLDIRPLKFHKANQCNHCFSTKIL